MFQPFCIHQLVIHHFKRQAILYQLGVRERRAQHDGDLERNRLPFNLRQPVAQEIAPGVGQRFELYGPPQGRRVGLFGCVEARDIGDSDALFCAAAQLDRVAGLHHAFFRHHQIKAGATASKKALDHVGPPELDAELVARHARLADDHLG